MPFKESLLSHFTGSSSNESNEQEDVREKVKPVADVHETAKPVADAPPSEHDASCLQLEANHPINMLWAMRKDEAGWLSTPALRLEGPPEHRHVLPADEVKKELSRLLFTVSSTANKRVAKFTKEASVTQDMDAEVVVFLSAGNLTAWVLVYPPIGKGQEVNRAMLDSALEANQVTFGIMEEALNALPRDMDRYFHMYLVAKGIQPVHGADGAVIDLFSRSAQRMAKVNEHGQMDYTELNLVQIANKGDIICRITPPTAGITGTSVLNQPISAKDGKSATIPQGRNTEVSKDGYSLIATEAGRVEFSGRAFEVKPILEINGNVDYSTGNINFLGDVQIHGDVCTGFTVRATGNVTVDGVVEACRVEAGGDLILQKGVKGDHQATIQSHKSIYAKYLENCNACARNVLQSDCLIGSNVYCDGEIQIESGRGVIIGGIIRAGHVVRAKTVGTKSGLQTIVGLGGWPSEEFECECLRREISTLEVALEKLERQPDNPFKLQKLPKVRTKLSADKTKLSQYEQALAESSLKEREQGYNSMHLVCATAYSGTEVTIGGITRHLESTANMCNASLIGGEIHLV